MWLNFPNSTCIFQVKIFSSNFTWLINSTKYNFSGVLQLKFVKFFMSILKRQVNSSSNFASFFIVVIYDCSVNFKLIHFLIWIKGYDQSPNFETFQVLWWIFSIFLMSFSKPQVSFSSSFASPFSLMKDNSSVLF